MLRPTNPGDVEQVGVWSRSWSGDVMPAGAGSPKHKRLAVIGAALADRPHTAELPAGRARVELAQLVKLRKRPCDSPVPVAAAKNERRDRPAVPAPADRP